MIGSCRQRLKTRVARPSSVVTRAATPSPAVTSPSSTSSPRPLRHLLCRRRPCPLPGLRDLFPVLGVPSVLVLSLASATSSSSRRTRLLPRRLQLLPRLQSSGISGSHPSAKRQDHPTFTSIVLRPTCNMFPLCAEATETTSNKTSTTLAP